MKISLALILGLLATNAVTQDNEGQVFDLSGGKPKPSDEWGGPKGGGENQDDGDYDIEDGTEEGDQGYGQQGKSVAGASFWRPRRRRRCRLWRRWPYYCRRGYCCDCNTGYCRRCPW